MDESVDPPENALELHFEQFENNCLMYGPWADHQRSIVQSFFYPRTFEDVPAIRNVIGKPRPYHAFDVRMFFNHPTTWIFPFIRTPRTPEEKATKKAKQENFKLKFQPGSKIIWSSANGPLNNEKTYTTHIKLKMNDVVVETTNNNASFIEAKMGEVML